MLENPYDFGGGDANARGWTDLPPGGPASARTWQGPRTSVLAVLSLVLSLLLCLPFLGPTLGLALGITALARMSASGGYLRGRGLALAGAIIGAVLLLAEGCLGLASWMAVDLTVEQAATTIRVAQAEDLGATKRAFVVSERDRISEEALAEFAAALDERFGTFRSARFDWSMTAAARGGALSNQPGSQQLELPLTLDFSAQRAYAIIRIQPDPQGNSVRTVRLTIYPERGEPLEFPPAP